MPLMLGEMIVLSVVMCALGWFCGYHQACRAHGWYLSRLDWENSRWMSKRQTLSHETPNDPLA
jgi:hypothetical protein